MESGTLPIHHSRLTSAARPVQLDHDDLRTYFLSLLASLNLRESDEQETKPLDTVSTRPWAKGLHRWLLTASVGIVLLGTLGTWSRANDLRDRSKYPVTVHAKIINVNQTDNPSLSLAIYSYRYNNEDLMGTASFPTGLNHRLTEGQSVLVNVQPGRLEGRMPIAAEAEIQDLVGRKAWAMALASFLFAFLAARLRWRVQTSKRYASNWIRVTASVSKIFPGFWKYDYPDESGNTRTRYKIGRIPRNEGGVSIYVNPVCHSEHVTLDSVNRYVEVERRDKPAEWVNT